MNKKELSQQVAAKLNATDKYAAEVVDLVVDLMFDALTAGDKVVLSGFGTFERRERASREGRNPRTGADITIAARTVVAFKPGKALKEAIEKKQPKKES